jgi:hypothetical protein
MARFLIVDRGFEQRRTQAHAEAERLRRQALGDFWRGWDALLNTAATQGLRAAHRLAARLRRHHRTLQDSRLGQHQGEV